MTLIYSDDGDTRSFTLGAEVLGYSLRYHLTSVPMIALVTESTSDSDRALLRRAGWAIQNIRTISNPNAQHAERLDY
ncbi:hypothetical protein J1F21_21070, partial [Aeromonas veronii]|uniref:hypothetical protein n=1 Tax=Aeromonas veronii TaxID=654 RepID=UPI001A8CB33F